MLEVVPDGVDKWVGMELLLKHFNLPRSALMTVGDGMNDLTLVANAGAPLLMGYRQFACVPAPLCLCGQGALSSWPLLYNNTHMIADNELCTWLPARVSFIQYLLVIKSLL